MNVIVVNQRGAARLKAGHLWIYRSDIASGDAPPGSLVEVRDPRSRRLGSALYSSSSQIAIRLLTSDVITEQALVPLIRDRIVAAIRFRKDNTRDTDSYRVIFSEADLLPGLIVDRYNDVLAIQVVTQAFDRAYERFDVLLAATAPSTAFPIGAKTDDPMAMYMSDVCTIPSNLSGHPAISVPFGTGDDGLPVGVQVLGPALSEPLIMRVAASLEAVAPQ